MPTPLENALKRKDILKAELEEIQRFIKAYRAFSDDGTGAEQSELPMEEPRRELISKKSVDNGDNFRRGRRPGKTAPSDIARIMERIIRDIGRPMTRGEIVDALERRDVGIPAQDKKRYVGTIAWRHKGTFENIEGKGYWVRDEKSPMLRSPAVS
jgi:reverse gyrase